MTQENYNVIVRVIKKGAPALAEELVNDLNRLVEDSMNYRKNLKEKEGE